MAGETRNTEDQAMNCARCDKRAPIELWLNDWAQTNSLGLMCPRCYAALQKIRRRLDDQHRNAMAKFMRGGRFKKGKRPAKAGTKRVET